MRIVALEEHFIMPALSARIDPQAVLARGFPGPGVVWSQTIKRAGLIDLGPDRIADMDASGITVQVLSLAGPGPDLVEGAAGIALARDYNDALAAHVAQRPTRYRGFAQLPLRTPEAAADELERCDRDLGFHGALINGATDGLFLDDPRFAPILARAEALDVPLYLHPGIPSAPVRAEYYDGLPGQFGHTLALAAWGWHMETAIHTLRLVLSGALDRHPRLQIIIGHMGEAIPFMLARIDQTLGGEAKQRLSRGVGQTILDQVWITTSGFFDAVPFQAALATFGAGRIMFSVDHPFASNAKARAFLDALPVSDEDRARIAHGNADRLLKLVP